MSNNAVTHDGAELYDLDFLTSGENLAGCSVCHQSVWLDDPEQFGSAFARIHRLVCG
ncbi:hypothetical protein MNVM_21300 [Mycobacterium novum]|uniref:Uncharacterized protein n=1 Tax=Mycobacterium novum TaxID=2492438 RepID=A0A7I7JNX2_9MYCO|nr:hypothetical protein [Mycobacterium novum]BBX13049.1 hypothetical protein MNVM_21300 [Mycobacterium novum]